MKQDCLRLSVPNGKEFFARLASRRYQRLQAERQVSD